MAANLRRATARIEPPAVRAHLLAALVRAAVVAFAVVAVVSTELAQVLHSFIGDPGMSGAAPRGSCGFGLPRCFLRRRQARCPRTAAMAGSEAIWIGGQRPSGARTDWKSNGT